MLTTKTLNPLTSFSQRHYAMLAKSNFKSAEEYREATSASRKNAIDLGKSEEPTEQTQTQTQTQTPATTNPSESFEKVFTKDNVEKAKSEEEKEMTKLLKQKLLDKGVKNARFLSPEKTREKCLELGIIE